MCGGMTVVCAYETAGVDVNRSFRITTMREAVGLILVIICTPGDRKTRLNRSSW